jgi:hypothetical protein
MQTKKMQFWITLPSAMSKIGRQSFFFKKQKYLTSAMTSALGKEYSKKINFVECLARRYSTNNFFKKTLCRVPTRRRHRLWHRDGAFSCRVPARYSAKPLPST